MWKIVGQAETLTVDKSGEWRGTRQLPEFYVDEVCSAHAAQETAVRILTDGRTLQGPIHFTMWEVDSPNDVIAVCVVAEGMPVPEYASVVHKLIPERVVPVV